LHPEFARIAQNPDIQIRRKDGVTFLDALKLSLSKVVHDHNTD